MTITGQEYNSREDDEELEETLEIMKNVHNIFENCNFINIKAKNFVNCHFICCTFEDIGASTFTNCQFDAPKFFDGFRGSFVNCNISSYTGRIGEVKKNATYR